MMKTNEITARIIEICIDIHRKLGPGLLESVYEAVLAHELERAGFHCERQKRVTIVYGTLTLEDAFRADLVVNGCVIVKLKSVEKLERVNFKQLLTYLRLTGIEVGLLINFNVPLLKDGLHRVVNGASDDQPLLKHYPRI